MALTDAYVSGQALPPAAELTPELRVGLLCQVMKYRIGSTTRIALGMDPAKMSLLEK